MENHHFVPEIKCRYCDFATSNNKSLEDHLVDSHEDIVILHTMAKPVDSLTDGMAELTKYMKILFENQDKINNQLSALIKSNSEESSSPPIHLTTAPQCPLATEE